MRRGGESLPRAAGLPGVSAETEGGVVIIAPALVGEIAAHAWSRYPRECCGILLGPTESPTEICAVWPTENSHATREHDRYEIDPREVLRADYAAEAQGRRIAGFYHSHPNHPARPSATDREFAWPGYVYLIASVERSGETRLTAWGFDEEAQGFRARRLALRGGGGEGAPGCSGRLAEEGG